ncbi:hypothetical protein LINPERHAP1_LOCUS639 [Linum perenne]
MVDYGEMALALTPTWAVGTVVTVMIAFGFFFQWLLKYFGKVFFGVSRFFAQNQEEGFVVSSLQDQRQYFSFVRFSTLNWGFAILCFV